MSIDLNILLSRNKIRLPIFCQELNILTYEDLVSHCKARDIVPCSKAHWAKSFPPTDTKTGTKAEPVKTASTRKSKTTTNAAKKSTRTPAKKTTTKSTKASSTQKKK